MEESKLRNLLESLTLKEKIGQLIQLSGEFYSDEEEIVTGPQEKLGISSEMIELSGSVLNVAGAKKTKEVQKNYLSKSRHKIPLLFMGDVVYGYKTVFPVPIGLGSTWNPDLVKNAYEVIAEEASAGGVDVTFAPMVDLVRDPRWGRVVEGISEDTYLTSTFSEAMVTGFQNDLNPMNSLASCVKHFVGYGAVEGGRDYNTVDMSERHLRQYHLPPYQAAVNADAKMVMTAFNTYDGVPISGNDFILKDILRDEWGFDGVIISDYAAIKELIDHGVAADNKEAAKKAIEASLDIDMKTNIYATQLEPLVENGEISERLIDESVWRILKLKNDLGLFEDPYRSLSEEAEEEKLLTEDNRSLAREVVSESAILLQNNKNVLPLKEDENILLTGPYGDEKALIGFWAIYGENADVVTLKEGIEKVVEPDHFQFVKGTTISEDYAFLQDFGASKGKAQSFVMSDEEKESELKEAIRRGKEANTIILALGEHTLQSGEGGSRTNLELPKNQKDFLNEMVKLGKKTVLIVFSGRPLILTDEVEQVDAILQVWFPGTEGGNGIADLLFGKANPSGRVTMSFPYNVGQIPVYYNHYKTGRPLGTSTHTGRFVSKYLDSPNDPLYPFGYGLSYSDIVYEDLTLDKNKMQEDEEINVSVTVKNNSELKAKEVVQLYIQDIAGSVVRPVKELKAFKKVELAGNSSKKVHFKITLDDLKFYTKEMAYEAEAGNFNVFVGPNSKDVLQDGFELI